MPFLPPLGLSYLSLCKCIFYLWIHVNSVFFFYALFIRALPYVWTCAHFFFLFFFFSLIIYVYACIRGYLLLYVYLCLCLFKAFHAITCHIRVHLFCFFALRNPLLRYHTYIYSIDLSSLTLCPSLEMDLWSDWLLKIPVRQTSLIKINYVNAFVLATMGFCPQTNPLHFQLWNPIHSFPVPYNRLRGRVLMIYNQLFFYTNFFVLTQMPKQIFFFSKF